MKTRLRNITVREAKARFSDILDAASQGEEFVVTSNGRSKAMIVGAPKAAHPLRIDIKWLKSMPLRRSATSADAIIRRDRDQRD